MKSKNVQISEELFNDICWYFRNLNDNDPHVKFQLVNKTREIRCNLAKKKIKLKKEELYSRLKSLKDTPKNKKEREALLQVYKELDEKLELSQWSSELGRFI